MATDLFSCMMYVFRCMYSSAVKCYGTSWGGERLLKCWSFSALAKANNWSSKISYIPWTRCTWRVNFRFTLSRHSSVVQMIITAKVKMYNLESVGTKVEWKVHLIVDHHNELEPRSWAMNWSFHVDSCLAFLLKLSSNPALLIGYHDTDVFRWVAVWGHKNRKCRQYLKPRMKGHRSETLDAAWPAVHTKNLGSTVVQRYTCCLTAPESRIWS